MTKRGKRRLTIVSDYLDPEHLSIVIRHVEDRTKMFSTNLDEPWVTYSYPTETGTTFLELTRDAEGDHLDISWESNSSRRLSLVEPKPEPECIISKPMLTP